MLGAFRFAPCRFVQYASILRETQSIHTHHHFDARKMVCASLFNAQDKVTDANRARTVSCLLLLLMILRRLDNTPIRVFAPVTEMINPEVNWNVHTHLPANARQHV